MNTRIKKIRRFFDLTQQAFAERIGMKQNTIALLESGKNSASERTILAICREFGVNETWLRTGEGEMLDPHADDALENLAREKGLSRAEVVLIEKFLNLEQPHKISTITGTSKPVTTVRRSNGSKRLV